MIAEKGLPGLSMSAFWMNLLHILLNGPFPHANIQLEQFPTDALCSPESVVGGHLLHQGNRLGRNPRLSRAHLRFALPEHAEELTMPTKERLWLNKEEGLFPGSGHPGEEHQKKPVCLLIGRSFDLPTQNDQLLS